MRCLNAPTSGCFSLADAASKHAALGFFDCLRAEVEEFDVVVSTVSPTFIRSYHVDPGQGNWEASLWKCELSEGTRGLGAGEGSRGARGVFQTHDTLGSGAPGPNNSRQGPRNFRPEAAGLTCNQQTKAGLGSITHRLCDLGQ